MNAKRLVTFICACSMALLLVPSDVAAQRRGGGGGSRGGDGGQTAVPRGQGHGGGPRTGGAGGYGGYRPGYYRPVTVYRPIYYRPYFYSPYWYNGFYASFYYGLGWYPYYSSYWAYGYPWGYDGYYDGYPCCGYPYPRYAYAAWSSARLQVKPRDAQVYVDGYFVGVVDEFDGVFQRLDVPAGEHEVAIYMPGFQTYRERTLFRPGQSYHYKAVLQPLPPGAPQDPKPQPAPNAPGNPPPYAEPGGRTHPMPERGNPRHETSNGFGTLNLRVQPGDATVTIDGEKWDSPEGGSRLSVQLAAGQHRIEVKKDGYRTYSATVDIRPGEAQSVNVVLPQGSGGAISGT